MAKLVSCKRNKEVSESVLLQNLWGDRLGYCSLSERKILGTILKRMLAGNPEQGVRTYTHKQIEAAILAIAEAVRKANIHPNFEFDSHKNYGVKCLQWCTEAVTQGRSLGKWKRITSAKFMMDGLEEGPIGAVGMKVI